MQVRYLGPTDACRLTHRRVYGVLASRAGRYRIMDDSGQERSYSADRFEVVDKSGWLAPVYSFEEARKIRATRL